MCMANHKWQCKKYMGDDKYSWAVFRDGRVWYTGMSRTEAQWQKKQCEKEDREVSSGYEK